MTNDTWLKINNFTVEDVLELLYEHKISEEEAEKMILKIQWKEIQGTW